MQTKFKAGDKVKCIDCSWGNCKPDVVYEVARSYSNGLFGVIVELTNDPLTYSSERFELYQEKPVPLTYSSERFELYQEKPVPHKHAEVIKAWADGAKIQFSFQGDNNWHDIDEPKWIPEHNYRIKPELKLDVVVFQNYYSNMDVGAVHDCIDDAKSAGLSSRTKLGILKLTFDGETDKLKSAEVVTE